MAFARSSCSVLLAAVCVVVTPPGCSPFFLAAPVGVQTTTTSRVVVLPPKSVMFSTPGGGPGGMSPEQMKMAAQAMKDLDADQIGRMLKEIEKMGPAEKEEMRKMGMNPEMLKMSMRLLKANPGALEMAKRQMEKMTPDQMAEASRAAQEQMRNMSPDQLETMARQANAATGASDAVPIDVPPASARDPALIDAFYAAGEFSSNPPTGGVDARAFKALPPIAALKGDLPDDLSDDEIEQVWLDHARPGDRRVDRAGFEQVWLAIDDMYDDDLMVEARRPPKKTRATSDD